MKLPRTQGLGILLGPLIFLLLAPLAGCGKPSNRGEASDSQAVYRSAMQERKNPQRPEVIALGIGGTTVEVEVAGAGAGLQLGLMFRDRLGENEGMWFEFSKEDYRSFWMRNTKVPLSIAFVDKKGSICNIEEMVPYNESPVRSRRKAMFALEMNRGWFKRKGIRAGDFIRIGAKKTNPRAPNTH